MRKGAFRSFIHDHHFETVPEGTVMKDILTFRSPLGLLGRVVDKVVMAAYLRRLLTKRNDVVRLAAESAV